MNNRSVRNGFTSLLIGAVALSGARAQDSTRDRDVVPLAKPATPSASASKTGAASRSGKGALPDPALLDGSTLPAEKKSETGMLGDFELPGDENVRNGRVGGQQQPPGQQGGQQGMQGMPPMAGGASGGQQSQQGQTPPMSAGGAAGAQQNQQQGQQQAGGGPAGANDPNAKAEGQQVGNLQTDPNAGGAEGAAGADAQKPQQVAIGDQAMQIKGVANAPSVVGGQVPAGQTQQMESKVGGGKGSSAVSGGRNSAEKGRAMPSGL